MNGSMLPTIEYIYHPRIDGSVSSGGGVISSFFDFTKKRVQKIFKKI